MKKMTPTLTAVVLTATLMASGVAFAHGAGDQGTTTPDTSNMGQGMMRQGMMDPDKAAAPGKMMGGGMGKSMGHGMMMGRSMGHGMSQGMMAGHASHHYQGRTIDRNLSADDVRKVLEGHFAWVGHKRLRVGDVKKQDDGSLLADVNTVDGSLVMRMEVDPKTGAMHHVNE